MAKSICYLLLISIVLAASVKSFAQDSDFNESKLFCLDIPKNTYAPEETKHCKHLALKADNSHHAIKDGSVTLIEFGVYQPSTGGIVISATFRFGSIIYRMLAPYVIWWVLCILAASWVTGIRLIRRIFLAA